MARKKKRRGVSAGTLFMLLLTFAVLAACVWFVLAIAGDGLYERTEALIHILAHPARQATHAPAAPTPAATVVRYVEATPSPTPVKTPTPVPQPVSFTLAAGGTIYAPKAIRQSVEIGSEQYDFDPVFSGLGTALSGADLAIVTLETTTAGKEKGYGNYNTPAEILDTLRACGVDLICLGTERALDKGYDGMALTVSEVTARGLAYVGVNPDLQERPKTNLIGVNGVDVAVLAYTYGLSDEGRERTREPERSAVSLLDMERMTSDITQARLDGADVVIVLPHWGTKNKQETPQDICDMAYALAAAGADIILGTHPNVVQGTQRLSVVRSDGLTYEAVVCYSLGSLLTDARTPENTQGMIARLTVTYDPVSRRTSLGDLACIPVYIARQREEGQNVYRVVDTENAAAVSALETGEQEAARQAAQSVRDLTGQAQREEEGEG